MYCHEYWKGSPVECALDPTIAQSMYGGNTFYRFSLKVKIGKIEWRTADRPTFLAAAEKARVSLGDWFCSPLHPIETGLERWRFHAGDFPVAERLARTVVNLPTDTLDPDKVLSFLNAHLALIEPI